MSIKRSGAIREEIKSLRQNVLNIVELATQEGRELTNEEKDIVDRIQGNGDDPGQMSQLQADLERAIRFEERVAEIANSLEPTLGAGAGIVSASGEWKRDGKGNRYAILNRDQKAANLFPRLGSNMAGHYILAQIGGIRSHTPQWVRNEWSTKSNEFGGGLVPDPLWGGIVDLATSRSVLGRAGITRIAMTSSSLTIPSLQRNLEMKPKAENVSFHESYMMLGSQEMTARTAGALTKFSREVLEDASEILVVQLEQFIAGELARQTDEWGLVGKGTEGEPCGIFNWPDVETTPGVGALDWLDVLGAATEVRDNNHEPTACVLHTRVYEHLASIQTGDGTTAARGWLGRPPGLENVTFLPTTHCPIDKLVIGDFEKMGQGVRLGARTETSNSAGDAFEKHQVHLKIFQRFDFTLLDSSAFHILEGITLPS